MFFLGLLSGAGFDPRLDVLPALDKIPVSPVSEALRLGLIIEDPWLLVPFDFAGLGGFESPMPSKAKISSFSLSEPVSLGCWGWVSETPLEGDGR